MKWFKDLKDLFKTEKARTLIKVQGNILNCVQLDSKQKPIKRYKVKFKNSTKLKKFWEKFMLNGIVNYYAKEKIFYSERLLRIKRV